MRTKIEPLQNLLGIALILLEMERRPQAIRADDTGVIRERQLDQRHPADIAALARGHLFTHHPRMAIPEEEDQSAIGNAPGTDICSPLDILKLSLANLPEQLDCPVEIVGCRILHSLLNILNTTSQPKLTRPQSAARGLLPPPTCRRHCRPPA